jgi:hypothetical protein
MSDALGLIGFYFTLIGFISGLFFTRIDSWYGEVRLFEGALDSLERADQYRDKRPSLEGLRASKPRGSFIAVGALLSVLTALAWFVPIKEAPVNPLVFVFAPITITVIAYWIGGIVLLGKGTSLLTGAEQKIDEGAAGG